MAGRLESSKDHESISLCFILYHACVSFRVFDDEEWFRSIFSASTKREAVQNQVSGPKRGGLSQVIAAYFTGDANAPSSTIYRFIVGVLKSVCSTRAF